MDRKVPEKGAVEKPAGYAGVDVGGANNTYTALLVENRGSFNLKTVKEGTLTGIVKYILEGSETLACAIDSPLSYSPSSKTGFRHCDERLRELLRRKFPARGEKLARIVMSPNSMQAVPLRGMFLARALRAKVGAVIETHPTASIALMLSSAGMKEGEVANLLRNYKRTQSALKVVNEALKEVIPKLTGIALGECDEHGYLDCAVCAITAYMYLKHPERLLKLTAPEDDDEGFAPFYIIHPESFPP